VIARSGHTVNGKDYVHNFKLLTMAAVICRRFTKNFLYQCDLKWELPFSPYTQKIFRFKCVFSVVVNSIFIAVKIRKKAKDVGGPVEFIDQQYTKRSLIPKR
jgi:hypothetical protein